MNRFTDDAMKMANDLWSPIPDYYEVREVESESFHSLGLYDTLHSRYCFTGDLMQRLDFYEGGRVCHFQRETEGRDLGVLNEFAKLVKTGEYRLYSKEEKSDAFSISPMTTTTFLSGL